MQIGDDEGLVGIMSFYPTFYEGFLDVMTLLHIKSFTFPIGFWGLAFFVIL